jgi:hypothetical protein
MGNFKMPNKNNGIIPKIEDAHNEVLNGDTLMNENTLFPIGINIQF